MIRPILLSSLIGSIIGIIPGTGATLIPLLTLGIPGDGTVALMLSALMINGLNPGLSLFTTDGDIMYAIMLGLILVNLFMLLQGRFLTSLFAKVVSIPQDILERDLSRGGLHRKHNYV